MLKIPEGVSQHLKDELEQFQRQIQILLRNHQILSIQAKKCPEDELIREHIKTVQNYLIKFSKEQKPVIEQIRAEVKRLNLAKEQQESLDDAKKNNESVDDEKDEEMSTVDNSETSFNDKTSQSCDISINKSPNSPAHQHDNSPCSGVSGDNEKSPGDTSDFDDKSIENGEKPLAIFKDRMAIVRAMRRKKKKPTSAGRPPKSGTATRTPSPKMDESGNEEQPHPEEESGSLLCPGHVTEVEKLTYPEPPKYAASVDDPIERPQTYIGECQMEQFMLNLELLTPENFERVVEHRVENRKRTFDFRNLTYIPEISDKKHRISYNYLSADLNSPPLLRTRQRRPPLNVSAATWVRPTSSRALSQVSRSASVSRGSTPEGDGGIKRTSSSPSVAVNLPAPPAPLPPSARTPKQLEPPSSETDKVSNEVRTDTTEKEVKTVEKKTEKESKNSLEKEKLGKELSTLEAKAKEVEASLGESNTRRTVATRKERTRLSELQTQKSKIESEINRIRRKMENLEKS